MADDPRVHPRTFYLNETHELTRAEDEGGGGQPNEAVVEWTKKSVRLADSLVAARRAVQRSTDPLRDHRFFLVAIPEEEVRKLSRSKKQPGAEKVEAPNYGGKNSLVFRRLGLDLLQVNEEGTAVVHATPERLDQLISTARILPEAGLRERDRWVTLESFAAVPRDFRLHRPWVESLPNEPADVVIELQPVLTDMEAQLLRQTITGKLNKATKEALTRAGKDYSGRSWFRAKLMPSTIVLLAEQLHSIQAIHPPLLGVVFSAPRQPAIRKSTSRIVGPPAPPLDLNLLPVVAVADCGVPRDHRLLASYCRGRYVDPDGQGQLGSHGSFVASRIVWGDLDFSGGLKAPPPPSCRFYDLTISEDIQHVDGKLLVPAMRSVSATAPDVRVFNLSFGSRLPLGQMDPPTRLAQLQAMADLDNFVFANDVVVIVAAGNSEAGIVPRVNYPDNHTDPDWALGGWAMGFNSLVCGSSVERVSPTGLVGTLGAPSPFTRVGPGLAGAHDVPSYGAHGGNCLTSYAWSPELGVYGCDAMGNWEDRIGTSYAAPILAREVAFAIARLQKVCLPGVQPFGAVVKAFLALTARRPPLNAALDRLADRTIGRGSASAARLAQPLPSSAVFLWQGVLAHDKDIARVKMPIPYDWLRSAEQPTLRLVCSWDSPVNPAVPDLWACRKVTAKLKASEDADALQGSKSGHGSFPLIDRYYDLSLSHLEKVKKSPAGDAWIVEIQYEEIADALGAPPQLRVAFTVELFDRASPATSPQSILQRLPLTLDMIALGVPRTAIPSPIIIQTRK